LFEGDLFYKYGVVAGSVDMNKEMHEDSKEFLEVHSQQQSQMGHSVLHPGLSRPLPPGLQNNQRQPPHPGKETRPSVIESSQPHIIECT
jgi:hypothetical protein